MMEEVKIAEWEIERLRNFIKKISNAELTVEEHTDMLNLIRQMDINEYFKWDAFTSKESLFVCALAIVLKHDMLKEVEKYIAKKENKGD